jgi:uncharacterized protein YutE (UPF0331/DUF86 family)
LDELSERLARLRPLQDKPRTAFDEAPYLRDIVERNLEIAAQCCIDISHRIISLENARKPTVYYSTSSTLAPIMASKSPIKAHQLVSGRPRSKSPLSAPGRFCIQ